MDKKIISAKGIKNRDELIEIVQTSNRDINFSTFMWHTYIKTSWLTCVYIWVNKNKDEIWINYTINPLILILVLGLSLGLLAPLFILIIKLSSEDGQKLIDKYTNEIKQSI